MVEQFAGMARVFAGDQVDFAEDAEGAESNILQVADRRGNDIKSAGHRSTMKR